MSPASLSTAIAVLACAMATTGCAGQGGAHGRPAVDPQVVLRDGAAPGAVRYEHASGRCSKGAVQLVDRAGYGALTDGWRLGATCDGAQKAANPDTAAYPALFARHGLPGSAQVLVRLEADGSVHSVHAICATDSAFAEAATDVARAIRYTPATCNGKPVRNAFLLPFEYAFR